MHIGIKISSNNFFQEHLITGLMEKVSTIALIVHLENTVKVKAMKYGQMIVQKDFIALAELTTLLLTMGSLESFVLLGELALQSFCT